MKKLIVSLLLTSALATSLGVTAGCNATVAPDTSANRSVIDAVSTSGEFYSYAAASVGSIISSNVAVSEQAASTGIEASLSAQAIRGRFELGMPQLPSEPTEEQLSTINDYMSLVENLLGEGKANSETSESDREGYEVKEVVSFSDLEGNLLTYTMYYNRTEISVEVEGDEDAGKHGMHGNTPHSDNETETEYAIDGIMVVGEEEYALEGKYETETSREGEESESFFKVTLSESSFIIMNQEIEEDEQSFVYCVYGEGKITESVRFSYETEKGETELKMVVNKDGERSELRFKEEDLWDTARVMSVRAKLNGQNISFTILITTDDEGNEVYRYQFGNSIRDMFKPDMHGFGKPGNQNPHPGQPQTPENGTETQPEQPQAPENGTETQPEQPQAPESTTDGSVA